MGAVVVESISVLAIAFLMVVFVALCRESRALKVCKVFKFFDDNNVDINRLTAHGARNAYIERPSRLAGSEISLSRPDASFTNYLCDVEAILRTREVQ